MEQTHALGRRKAAVARVYLTAGKGNITINDRPLENYFPAETLRYVVNQPLEVTGTAGQFDIQVTICGGGTKGQAVSVSPAPSASWTVKLTVLHSRPPVSSPAMHARSSARSPVSPEPADASSSANVSLLLIYGTEVVLNIPS